LRPQPETLQTKLERFKGFVVVVVFQLSILRGFFFLSFFFFFW
jgi:hypothetical protein